MATRSKSSNSQDLMTTTDISPRPVGPSGAPLTAIGNGSQYAEEQIIGILTHHNSSSAIKTGANSQQPAQFQDLPSRVVETDPNPTPSAAHLFQEQDEVTVPMSIGHTEVVVLDTPNMSLMHQSSNGHSMTCEGAGSHFLTAAPSGGGGTGGNSKKKKKAEEASSVGQGSALLAHSSSRDWVTEDHSAHHHPAARMAGGATTAMSGGGDNTTSQHRARMHGLSVPHKATSMTGQSPLLSDGGCGTQEKHQPPIGDPHQPALQEEGKPRSLSPRGDRNDDDDLDGRRSHRHRRSHHHHRSSRHHDRRGKSRSRDSLRRRLSSSPRTPSEGPSDTSSRRHHRRHRSRSNQGSRHSSSRHNSSSHHHGSNLGPSRYDDERENFDRSRRHSTRHRDDRAPVAGGPSSGRPSTRDAQGEGRQSFCGRRSYDRRQGLAAAGGGRGYGDEDDEFYRRDSTTREVNNSSFGSRGRGDSGGGGPPQHQHRRSVRMERSPPRRYDQNNDDSGRRSKKPRFEAEPQGRQSVGGGRGVGGNSRKSQGGQTTSGRPSVSTPKPVDLDAQLEAYQKKKSD